MLSNAADSTPPLVRIGHLMAFSSFLDGEGAPVDKMLSRAGLPVLFEDSNCFVPLTRVWSFIDAAADSLDPELGWLVGKHAGDHHLNAGLRKSLERAPSLHRALVGLVEKIRSEASHLQLGIREHNDHVQVFTHYPGMDDMPGYHQSQAYQLGVFLDLIRHFLGQQWSPEVVGIQAEGPTTEIRNQLPDCQILTGQRMGYLTVPRACLHMPAGNQKAAHTGNAVRTSGRSFDFDATLRELLKTYLSEGYPSARMAAELMGVSERTLARRLSQHGLTYGELVDEVRFTVARHLLRNPEARIGEVAMAVGFADQSNFTRMFRRMGGLSPREFRAATIN